VPGVDAHAVTSAEPGKMLGSKVLEENAKTDPVVWCLYYRKLKRKPFVFDVSKHLPKYMSMLSAGEIGQVEYDTHLLRHRPFLVEPLRDLSRHKVYRKSRQMGVSEITISEVLWFLWSHPKTKHVYCVPDDAEILTRRGWKFWHEVLKDDEVLTLDDQSYISHWERLNGLATFDWEGSLDAVGPFHCTDDHRWPVERRRVRGDTYKRKWYGGERKMVTVKELRPHLHKIPRLAPHCFAGPSVLSPRLAAILGWVVTDGWRYMTGTAPNLNTPMMSVAQSSKKHLRLIEKLLRNKRYASKWTKAKTVKQGPRGGRVVGYTRRSGTRIYGDCYSVRVRREDADAITAAGYASKADLPSIVTRLSRSAAKAMWEAMLLAEGNVSGPRGSSIFFAQKKGPVLDAFQILCTLRGCYANLSGNTTAHSGCYVTFPGTQKAWLKPGGWKTKKRSYKGVVWCPQTPSGTWCMRYRGKVVFTGNCFPRDRQLEDFSNTRIQEAFAETPRMASLKTGINQVMTKKIGESFLILRSAWESNLGEGVDADGVVFDEKDRMRPGVDAAFIESLQSSPWKLLREVSTPSLPGQGVDENFQKSDQRFWFVKCEKCGEWQTPTFPDNILQLTDVPPNAVEIKPGSFRYACHRSECRGKLDRLYGRWVPKFPDRSMIRGYQMNQLMAPWLSADDIMYKRLIKKEYKHNDQAFYNYVLGLPSSGTMKLVQQADLEASVAGHEVISRRTKAWDLISVGIDWGHLNWVYVQGQNSHNGKQYMLDIRIFEDQKDSLKWVEQDLVSYLQAFEPNIIIADGGYGKDRNAILMKAFNQYIPTVFSCVSKDAKVAMLDARGWKCIKDVRVGDWTYAWDGNRCVPTRVNAVWNRGKKKVVRVVCRDGHGNEKSITCTPDHAFPLRLGGRKRADALQPGDRLVPFLRWDVVHGKYRMLNTTNESKYLEYEHRVVMPDAAVVHHINHDGKDNRPENLRGYSSRGEHNQEHPKKMGDYPVWVEAMRMVNQRDMKKMVRRTHTAVANAKRRETWRLKKQLENHVVVRVEDAGTDEVWDLSVEHSAHNFALYEGVFVKNCDYNSAGPRSRTHVPVWSEASSRVLVDRNTEIKRLCHEIREKQIGLTRWDRTIATMAVHFNNLAPILVEEEGEEPYEDIRRTGDDHLVHAMLYANLGMRKLVETYGGFRVSWVGPDSPPR
jgi:hypothetical protein